MPESSIKAWFEPKKGISGYWMQSWTTYEQLLSLLTSLWRWVQIGKTKITMTKPVYLRKAILDLSKTLIYEFRYEYMHPKCGSKVKLCQMDSDNFRLTLFRDRTSVLRHSKKCRYKIWYKLYIRHDNRPLPTERTRRLQRWWDMNLLEKSW